MILKQKALSTLLAEVADHSPQEAFGNLKAWLDPRRRYVDQTKIARAVDKLLPQLPKLKPLRIALVSSFTTNYFVELLRLWLRVSGIEPEFYVAPFDMVAQTVLDGESELYKFAPDVVWLLTSHRDLHFSNEAFASRDELQQAVDRAIAFNKTLWQAIHQRCKAVVLQNNADVPVHDAYGNWSGGSALGARNAYRLFNARLVEHEQPGVIIVDIDHLSSRHGKTAWADPRSWFLAKVGFDLDASGLVACVGARLIASAKGLSKKCVVLDLDNTLWGGVIGDDGMAGIKLGNGPEGEPFSAFQRFLKQLSRRGIILAVCSKNELVNAKEPFEAHPDMQLRLDDIAVFRASWDNKADSIRNIARTLNIGTDSLLFVDDNPTERQLVRRYLPEVEVPELPEDPAGYIDAVAGTHWFELITLLDDDRERTRFYRENALREELGQKFTDPAEFLTSLKMTAQVATIDALSLPRVAQLINKSNQFHLTTTRYSEAQVQAFAQASDVDLLHFRLVDQFGDNGIISAVILKHEGDALHIDTWVMSCRVLARTMEEFIMREIHAAARRRSVARIIGRYRPTSKNKLVEKLFEKLGFQADGGSADEQMWTLPVTESAGWITYVK